MNVLLESEGATSNTVGKYGQTLLSWPAKHGHTHATTLRERYRVSRDLTHLIGQIALIQTPEEQYRGIAKQRSENLGFIPQLAGNLTRVQQTFS